MAAGSLLASGPRAVREVVAAAYEADATADAPALARVPAGGEGRGAAEAALLRRRMVLVSARRRLEFTARHAARLRAVGGLVS